MSWEKIFEVDDGGACVIAEVSQGLVQITEAEEQCVVITVCALAGIALAVADYLEEPLFIKEDLRAAHRTITEYLEARTHN